MESRHALVYKLVLVVTVLIVGVVIAFFVVKNQHGKSNQNSNQNPDKLKETYWRGFRRYPFYGDRFYRRGWLNRREWINRDWDMYWTPEWIDSRGINRMFKGGHWVYFEN
jgi:hypothetical protein